ncbi:MAG: RNA methyltransferase [candidate division KSB1 bacterium]|nr:RNA methyltransferase [candidate division KSB1 bacterium]
MKRPLNKNEIRSTKLSRDEFLKLPRNPIYVVLDSLKCAHNIGTIIRLSDALLVNRVYICGSTIVPPNRKIKASSRGSEKWVAWEYREDIVELIKELKDKGIFIVSSEISNSSINYYDAEYKIPICLVLGREYDGICEEVLNLSDCIVHLPMYGMCNSINVATAASVLLYDILRRIKHWNYQK